MTGAYNVGANAVAGTSVGNSKTDWGGIVSGIGSVLDVFINKPNGGFSTPPITTTNGTPITAGSGMSLMGISPVILVGLVALFFMMKK